MSCDYVMELPDLGALCALISEAAKSPGASFVTVICVAGLPTEVTVTVGCPTYTLVQRERGI